MKRVKAACILQTLVFSQRPEMNFSVEQCLKLNRADIRHYKATLDRASTKYKIVEEREQADGSIVVKVKKQYNDRVGVGDYLD